VTIAAGRTKTIAITLNANGRRLLKSFHQLPVTLMIKLSKSGKMSVSLTRKLTVRPKNQEHAQRLTP